MSSLVRRLQIRAMQKQGLVRTKYILVMDAKGGIRKQPVQWGGLILNSDNKPLGYRWPTPSRLSEPKPARQRRPARGSRRGKRSTWRSQRAEA